MNPIIYNSNKVKYKDVIEHLKQCDNSFSPKLSSYVDIDNYAKKIFDYAITFEAWLDNKLVGLVACYLNDEKKNSGFITNVSVVPNFIGHGIANQLLINCEEYAVNENFKYLRLEVKTNNKKAISLYKNNGFEIANTEGENYNMKKQIKKIEPLVSINCLTYNHGKYIRKTLESFMMQKTDFPFEVLVHDDASTDETTEIVKEFEEKYPNIIKPIFQKENQHSKGISISVTYNFPRAKGKYIAMCEGDDYWTDPYKLQKQVDFLEANDDYVITYHNARIIDENGKVVNDSKLTDNLKKDFSQEELIKGVMILTLTMCFRNVIKEFPKEFHKVKNGDKFLTSLLGNYGKGKYLSEIKDAVYRKHDASIWSSLEKAEQIFHNGNTRAWLSRYYGRIGKTEYAQYFNNEVIKHFKRIFTDNIAGNIEQKQKLAKKILSEYKDIIDFSMENELEDILKNLEQKTENTLSNLDNDEIAKLNDLTVLSLTNGKPEEAFKLIKDVLKADKDNNSALENFDYLVQNFLLEEIEQLISENNLEEAKQKLQKLLKINSNNIDVLNDLSVIAIMENNIEYAIELIKKVLRIEPLNDIAQENFNYLKENFELTKPKKNNPIQKVGDQKLLDDETVTINWVVTRKCNYSCSYCRVFDNSGKFTPFEHFKNAVDQIAELNKSEYKIVLTGGEPTIHPNYSDLLNYIFAKLGKQATIVTITNLGRTEKFFGKLLKEIKGFEKNVVFVASFHTEFANEDDFVKNAKLISEKGFFIKVQVMAHPEKMKQIRYLDKKFKEIKNENLKYQVMVIRENYGSVPDKRYKPEDLEWLKIYYSNDKETKNILIETKDLDSNIVKNYYSAPEINAKGLNNYKGMICYAGVNNFSINKDGRVDRAVCFRGKNKNARNIYTEKDALKGMDEPVICPFERCGCTADIIIPKFTNTEVAAVIA